MTHDQKTMAKKQQAKRNTRRAPAGKKKKPRGYSLLRRLVAVVALAGLGALGVLGWQWTTSLRCQRIVLSGLQHADSTALVDLAQVDTGMVLVDIDPTLVADRMRRHPWVQRASATRYPTGTLHLSVQEREPQVLVMDGRGQPSHYLDRAGYAMPFVPGTAYDVPLVHGLRERYHPVRRLQHAAMQNLLGVLANLDAETDALVSELEILPSGAVRLRTTPVGAHASLPVELGHDGFAEKMRRLHAFWHQAVLPQPNKTFQLIDLRFDGQIVTREAEE